MLLISQCNTQTSPLSQNVNTEYRPEGSVSIRFRKTLLTGKDLHFIKTPSFIEETYLRKSHQLLQFQSDIERQYLESLYQQKVSQFYGEDSNNSQSNQSDEQFFKAYLSTNHYKHKNFFIEGKDINKDDPSQTFQQGHYQQDPSFVNQQQQNQLPLSEFPKDNSYLNFAFNIKTSYTLPVEKFESIEQQQIIESFYEKKAQVHASENYEKLRKIFDRKVIENIDLFSNICFTRDSIQLIQNLSGGIIPNQIQNLKQGSQEYNFFYQNIDISLDNLTFGGEIEILIPKMEIIEVKNKNNQQYITIKEIISSSPEISFYYQHEFQFPLVLGPNQNFQIRLVIIPETYGKYESLVSIVFQDYIFIKQVETYIIPNLYMLEPYFFTDVLLNQTYEQQSLEIFNFMNNEYLIIEELYQTEDFIDLKWPNNAKLSKNQQIKDIQNSNYLKINPLQRKSVIKFTFLLKEAGDQIAEIHIRTSRNDLIRVPLYFHCHKDPIKFFPTIADFGLVASNFYQLKINLKMKTKQKESIIIHDIYVPIDDERLDFVLIESKKLITEKEFNNGLEKGTLKEKRVFKQNQELYLGLIILNPSKPGHIDSQLIITYSSAFNQSNIQKISYPIIGYIKPPYEVKQQNAANFDISQFLLNDTNNQVLFKIPQFSKITLQDSLEFTNILDKPIALRKVINDNPEINIRISPEILQQLQSQNGLMVHPQQTIKFGNIELLTQSLKISQGTKFFSLQLNETLLPMSVLIFDRSLLCVWEEEYNSLRFLQCSQGYDILYGTLAINETRYKKVNITNMNPIDIEIEQLTKPKQDEMQVFVESIYYKNKKIQQYMNPITDLNFSSAQYFQLISQKKTKSNQIIKIQQFQTYTFVFAIQSKDQTQRESKVTFTIKNKQSQDFEFKYQFNVVKGQLTMMPYQLYFDPAFPGILQQKSITAKSTFDQTIIIKSIQCSDQRIQIKLVNNVIIPKNKSEIALLTFDPAKQTTLNIHQATFDISQLLNNQQFQVSNLGQLNAQIQLDIKSLLVLNSQQQNSHIIIQNSQGLPIQIKGIENQQKFFQANLRQQIDKFNSPLQFQDIFSWKEKQKNWDNLGNQGKTEISATFTIETNLIQTIEVPVKAYLSKPQIIVIPEDDVLNFGTVQIGTQVSRSIKIYNPSQETLFISLYLVDENYFKELQKSEVSQQEKNSEYEKEVYDMMYFGIKDKKKKSQSVGNDIGGEKSKSNYQESYISMYCASKLKNGLYDDSLFERVDSLDMLIDIQTDIVALCLNLLDIANTYTIESVELDTNLKKNLEPYFKELYLSEQQENQNKAFYVTEEDKKQKITFSDQVLGQINDFNFYLEQISKSTAAKPIDVVIAKTLYQNSQIGFLDTAFYMNIVETIKKTFKQIFQDHSIRHYEKVMTQNSVPYRLKNPYLDDILTNNGTNLRKELGIASNLNNNQQKNNQQQQGTQQGFENQLSNQSFFINPKVQAQFIHQIEPQRNLTISEAIIFYPQSLKQEQISMTLLIKNNLTIIYPIELRGSGGTGIIEFTKILKKTSQINEQSTSNSHFESLIKDKLNQNYTIKNESQNSEQREKIIQFVYGDLNEDSQDQQMNEQLSMQVNNHTKSTASNYEKIQKQKQKEKSNSKMIMFSISIEDLLQFDENHVDKQGTIFQQQNNADNNQHISQLDLLLSDKTHEIKVNNYHRRILIAQNTGNLPVTIEHILIEGRECQSFGFIVENCHKFTLQPGETHQIYLSYQTDFSLAKVKKVLILESQHFTMEYIIQVQIPIRFLSLAHQMMPLNKIEESLYYFLTLTLALIGSLIVYYISRDIISHCKFSKEAIYSIDNEVQQNNDQSQLRKMLDQKTLNKKERLSLPIIKDSLIPDQIVNQFQTVADKFENQNQLLLKEIVNVCSKKNSVVQEIQKQALDKKNTYNNKMNLAKYFEKNQKEEIIPKSLKTQQSLDEKSKYIQDFQVPESSKNQIPQKVQKVKLLDSNEISQESGSFKMSFEEKQSQISQDESNISQPQNQKKNLNTQLQQKKKIVNKQLRKQDKRREEIKQQQQIQQQREIELENIRQINLIRQQQIEKEQELQRQQELINERQAQELSAKQELSSKRRQEFSANKLEDIKQVQLQESSQEEEQKEQPSNEQRSQINNSNEHIIINESLQQQQDTYEDEEPEVIYEQNISVEKIPYEPVLEQSDQKYDSIMDQDDQKQKISVIEVQEQINPVEKQISPETQKSPQSQEDQKQEEDMKKSNQGYTRKVNQQQVRGVWPAQQNTQYYQPKRGTTQQQYKGTQQANVQKRGAMNWSKGQTYYQSYDEEIKQPYRYQPTYQASNQNPVGSKRVVINTMKNQVQQLAQQKYKSKGPQGYYYKNNEYQDDYNQYESQYQPFQPIQHHQSSQSYGSSIYQRKSKESYDDEQEYAKKEYFKVKNDNRKKDNVSEKQDTNQDEDDQIGEDFQFYSEEEDKSQMSSSILDTQGSEIKNTNQIRAMQLDNNETNKFVQEFEKQDQNTNQQRNDQYQLSKNELEPFFNSHNKDESQNKEALNQVINKQIFILQGNSKFGQFQNTISEEGDYSEEEFQDKKAGSGINFYNVFQSVNNVFSQQSYGGGSSHYQKRNQDQNKKIFEYPSAKDITSNIIQESDDEEDVGSSSLFTKSLFGNSSIYQNQRKKDFNIGIHEQHLTRNNQQTVTQNTGFSALDELRKESKPVTSYSLFQNMSLFNQKQLNDNKNQGNQMKFNIGSQENEEENNQQ